MEQQENIFNPDVQDVKSGVEQINKEKQTKNNKKSNNPRWKVAAIGVFVLIAAVFAIVHTYFSSSEHTDNPMAKSLFSGSKGLNYQLPIPLAKKDSNWNKMSYYNQADKDSAKKESWVASLLNIQLDPVTSTDVQQIQDKRNRDKELSEKLQINMLNAAKKSASESLNKDSNLNAEESSYENELPMTKIMTQHEGLDFDRNQLEMLNADTKNIKGQNPLTARTRNRNPDQSMNSASFTKGGLYRGDSDSNENMDSDLRQLNTMIDKVMDIQHPERLTDQLSDKLNQTKRKVLTVKSKVRKQPVSYLRDRSNSDNHNGVEYNTNSAIPDSLTKLNIANSSVASTKSVTTIYTVDKAATQNNFYNMTISNDLSDQNRSSNATLTQFQAIWAETEEDQTITPGAILKLRLRSAIELKGITIPRGLLIYGQTSLRADRLCVDVHTIRIQDELVPVDLSVYDLDGQLGIYVPGSISRDVAKMAVGQSIQSIGMSNYNPSIGSQVMDAGMQAARSLVGKKVKLIKLTVRSGYRLMIIDNSIKDKTGVDKSL